MKILHVHNNNGIVGGSEVYIRDVLNELNARGNDCTLFVFTKSGSKYNFYKNYDLQGTFYKKELELLLRKEILKLNIDIIHIHHLPVQFLIELFLSMAPTVRHMHGPLLVCPGSDKYFRKSDRTCTVNYGLHCLIHAYTEKCFMTRMPLNVIRAYKATIFEAKYATKHYKFIIANSEFLKNEACKSGIPSEKIDVNPYFTASKEFNNYSPTQKKNILFIGRLVPQKGISILLEAMSKVLTSNKDVYLEIIGDGPLMPEVVSFISKEKLDSKVKIYGWKKSNEISDILNKCYAVIFPSTYPEAFGIVGIEAAMHSKPVVAFDVGGVKTWLIDKYNGYLIKEISSVNLTGKISELLTDEEEYKKMCSNAFTIANQKFTKDRHIEQLLKLYKECISK